MEELAFLPTPAVGANRFAEFVEAIEVGIPRAGEIDGVVERLGELDAEGGVEVRPIHGVRKEVIAATDGEVINQRDDFGRLFAGCIFSVEYLHFEVVGK